jgi:hypothetical protein
VKQKMNRKKVEVCVAVLLSATLILGPLAMYAYTFGTDVINDHQRWAEFGSFLSGIYSPLLAGITLVVLVAQVALQKRQTLLQQQFTDHERDQAYLVQARADIDFYATRMAEALNSIALPGVSLRAHLHQHFQPSNAQELDSPALRQMAANIHNIMPPTFDIWAAIYPILMGMKAGKTLMFDLAYVSSSQKLIALLGFDSCVVLDNFHRVRCERQTKIEYTFSPFLSQDRNKNGVRRHFPRS